MFVLYFFTTSLRCLLSVSDTFLNISFHLHLVSFYGTFFFVNSSRIYEMSGNIKAPSQTTIFHLELEVLLSRKWKYAILCLIFSHPRTFVQPHRISSPDGDSLQWPVKSWLWICMRHFSQKLEIDMIFMRMIWSPRLCFQSQLSKSPAMTNTMTWLDVNWSSIRNSPLNTLEGWNGWVHFSAIYGKLFQLFAMLFTLYFNFGAKLFESNVINNIDDDPWTFSEYFR